MRTRHFRTAAVLTGLLIVPASVLVAPVARAETVKVPRHATLVFRGHGWGHGHGLSQYGAQGAAIHGLNAQQIVRFYYPHTKAGQVGGKVRVLISADTDRVTTVVDRAGLEVHALGGATHSLPSKGAAGKAGRWRLSAGSGTSTKVAYRHNGWHLWRTLPGQAEFTAAKPITLLVPGGRVTYRGSLQSRIPAGKPASQRVTVNRVSLESYVQGVVPREMPALWRTAALRAQAIAARTYAAFEARDASGQPWNLCDTSSCQVYGGKSAEAPTSNAAVKATRHQVRVFHGAPAFTQFSSSDGGWTAAGGKRYLPAQKDPYEKYSGNPYHSWTTRVTAARIATAFGLGTLQSVAVDRRDGHGQWHGRVEKMTLVGSKATRHVSGDDVRIALGLRSTWFAISVASG
jgi:SpoIID/LytB domain protein